MRLLEWDKGTFERLNENENKIWDEVQFIHKKNEEDNGISEELKL